jgi:hypothetical protein
MHNEPEIEVKYWQGHVRDEHVNCVEFCVNSDTCGGVCVLLVRKAGNLDLMDLQCLYRR